MVPELAQLTLEMNIVENAPSCITLKDRARIRTGSSLYQFGWNLGLS